MATIERSGPFSRFEGYKRGLIRIAGDPFSIKHTKQKSVAIGMGRPYFFSGDLETNCELLGSTATDLNVMIKKDRGEIRIKSFLTTSRKPHFFEAHRRSTFVLFHCCCGEVEIDDQLLLPSESLKGPLSGEIAPRISIRPRTPQARYVAIEILEFLSSANAVGLTQKSERF